jgi:hypothetical protein
VYNTVAIVSTSFYFIFITILVLWNHVVQWLYLNA